MEFKDYNFNDLVYDKISTQDNTKKQQTIQNNLNLHI